MPRNKRNSNKTSKNGSVKKGKEDKNKVNKLDKNNSGKNTVKSKQNNSNNELTTVKRKDSKKDIQSNIETLSNHQKTSKEINSKTIKKTVNKEKEINNNFKIKEERKEHNQTSKFRPPSLRNLGATCYLNSAFQGISACGTFVKEINDLSKEYDTTKVKQLHVFNELIAILNGCSKDGIEISRNPIFREWNKPGQQDSYELLAYSLNQVYNDIRKHKEDSGLIEKRNLVKWLEEKLPMRVIIQYLIKCECQMIVKCPLQSDLALHVTIPKDKKEFRLDDLLDLYFAEDRIIDYTCDKQGCTGKKAMRWAKLCKPLPNTICIHLQRTYWNGTKMVKINNEVKFGTTLIIKSEFCSEKHSYIIQNEDKEKVIKTKNIQNTKEIMINKIPESLKLENILDYKEESTKIVFDGNVDGNNKEEDKVYELVSVIQHSGTVGGGHYVCYKKVDNRWFLTNDSRIEEVPESRILNCQAYILFYEQPYDNRILECKNL